MAVVMRQIDLGHGRVLDLRCPCNHHLPRPPVRTEALETDADERAAIVEHDAGIPREWAEGYAKLCTMPRPAGIGERDWMALIDGTGRLLDRWGAQLSAMGWSTEDVFGIHGEKPIKRFERAGLVRFLLRNEVVEITPETARLVSTTGAVQIYRRSPLRGEGWTVPWNLGSTEATSLPMPART
jgi:hypothetical protein